MNTVRKILVINLGSTSSKLAYCENDTIIRQVELHNDMNLLRSFKGAEDVTAFFGRHVDDFIRETGIDEFYVTGADATACVKSTCFNMAKAGFRVHVISDCVTSYDLKKLPEMFTYYADKGCEVKTLAEYRSHHIDS